MSFENSSLALPAIDAGACPADFAIVNNVADARQAFLDPQYSNIFYMVTIPDEVQRGRQALAAHAQQQLPGVVQNVRAFRVEDMCPYSFFPTYPDPQPRFDRVGRDFVRKDISSALFTPYLPEVPHKQAVAAFTSQLTHAFMNITAAKSRKSDALLHSMDFDFGAPTQALGRLHQDERAVGLFNLVGPYATPVASWAKMLQAAKEGRPEFHDAVRGYAIHAQPVKNATPVFCERPETYHVLPFMYRAPQDAMLIVKPSKFGGKKVARPSTHRVPWRGGGLPEAKDLRLLYRVHPTLT